MDESEGFSPVPLPDPAKLRDDLVSAAFLANLLAETYLPHSARLVAENRASGIPAMIRALREAGLGQAIFKNHPSRFEVQFDRSALLAQHTGSAILEWRAPAPRDSTRDIVARELHRLGRANSAHLVVVAGRSRPAVLKALRTLIDEGVVEAEGEPRSPHRTYRWVADD